MLDETVIILFLTTVAGGSVIVSYHYRKLLYGILAVVLSIVNEFYAISINYSNLATNYVLLGMNMIITVVALAIVLWVAFKEISKY